MGPKFGPKLPKSDWKLVFFYHFFQFGLLVFLKIAYNDSMQQCITSIRGKTHKKNFKGPNGPNQVFCHFANLAHQFSGKLDRIIARNIVSLQVENEPMEKKILGVPNWVQNGGFYHFFKVASLTNHITQDCRSGQCLTSSRGETSRKKICGPSWGPLKLACFSWCWFTSKRLQRGIL